MATLAQIKADVDSRLATLWAVVLTKQAAYFAAQGRYFQGLWTHAAPPADDNLVAPDQLDLAPVYSPDTWNSQGYTLGSLPYRLKIDQYDGPYGQGFIGTVEVTVLGNTYSRAKNSGPETWRDMAWTLIS